MEISQWNIIIAFLLLSLAFVVSLSWQSAVKGLLDRFLGKHKNLLGLWIYAIIVTLLLIGAVSLASKKFDTSNLIPTLSPSTST